MFYIGGMEINNDLKADILQEIEAFHAKTNGKCGIRPLDIAFNLNVPYSTITSPLNQLHKSKQVKVRQGINSYLIFKA